MPSLALVAYGVTVVIGRLVCARQIDRFPPLTLLLASAALATMGAGLLVLGTVATEVGVVVGAVVIALGVVFSTPAFFAAIFATAAPEQRGAASGTASVALDLGFAGGPLITGVVARTAGIPSAFTVIAALTFAGMLWTLFLARRRIAGAQADTATAV